MSVVAGTDPKISQVQYMFDAHYDPAALRLNGQPLCSFCPVYRKTPVKVELYLNPGAPYDMTTATCPNGGVSMFVEPIWGNGWKAMFPDNIGFVNNWDVVNTPDMLAQKNVPKTTNSFIGVQYTDQGTFKLKPCTGPANASAGTCTQ